RRHDFADEDHRIADERRRIELLQRIRCRGAQNVRVEQRRDSHLLSHGGHSISSDQNTLPAFIMKCSMNGPRGRPGKYSSPPTIRITPNSSATNSGPLVGNVPADGGTRFLAAMDPAMAITGTSQPKRQISIVMPMVASNQGVLALRPAKALPLLP